MTKICVFRKPRIAVAPDGNSIICWHPEPEFPYEYSQVCMCVAQSSICKFVKLKLKCLEQKQLTPCNNKILIYHQMCN